MKEWFKDVGIILAVFCLGIFVGGKMQLVDNPQITELLKAKNIEYCLKDTLDIECRNLLGNIHVHLTLQPDKGLVFIRQFLGQLGSWHLQQLAQFFQLGRLYLHVFWDSPDTGGWHTGS